MPGWKVWLVCVAEAVCARGRAALAGHAPFAALAGEIGKHAWAALSARLGDAATAALEEAARLTADELETAAAEVAGDVGAALESAERETLTRYLWQVPAAVRATLRRPSDPEGVTVGGGYTPNEGPPPVPARVSRFRAGERPLPGVPYELVELLGVGGFGEVWKARNTEVKLLPAVALKFCLDPLTRSKLEEHEARLAALVGQVPALAGPDGVVTLRNAYLKTNPSCLEYEYVPGGDLAGLLREWQRDGGPLADRATACVARLARVVGALHRHAPPVVHRDLKPSNVLVQRTADGGYALRVADFGIGGIAAGVALDRERTGQTSRGEFLTAALLGSCTPLYASPQQRTGAKPDPRDDVHALGVIWFQLLTGDVRSGVGVDFGEELAERGVPEELRKLLGSCVAAKADRRPKDAVELADRIEALMREAFGPATAGPEVPVEALMPGADYWSKHAVDFFAPAAGYTGPRDVEALVRQARSLVNFGDDETAISLVRTALQISPGNMMASDLLIQLLLKRAERCIQNGLFVQASADATEILKLVPQHPTAGRIQSEADQAIQANRRAVQEMRLYLLVLNEAWLHPEAAADLGGESGIDLLSSRVCGTRLTDALSDMDAGRARRWRIQAWQAKTDWVDLPQCQRPMNLGDCFRDESLKSSPACREGLLRLVARQAIFGETILKEAMRRYPDSFTAVHYLALALAMNGKVDAARATFDKVRRLEPNAGELERIQRALRLLE